MLCSGDKTKLLIVCNRETRESKINSVNKHFTVEVCGKTIEETCNEKLLGVIMSSNMSWNTHLYGKTTRTHSSTITEGRNDCSAIKSYN